MGPATCCRRASRSPRPGRRHCRGISRKPAPESTTSNTTAAIAPAVMFSFLDSSVDGRCAAAASRAAGSSSSRCAADSGAAGSSAADCSATDSSSGAAGTRTASGSAVSSSRSVVLRSGLGHRRVDATQDAVRSACSAPRATEGSGTGETPAGACAWLPWRPTCAAQTAVRGGMSQFVMSCWA